MGGSSGGGGTTSTVSQTAIPDWQQGAVQANENLATALAAQPYPTYSGQLIAGFTPQQTQGMQMAGQASTAQAPDLAAAEGYANAAPGLAQPYMQAAGGMANAAPGLASPYLQAAGNMAQAAPGMAQPYYGAAGQLAANATTPWSASAAAQYMNPYAQAALQPQIQALQLQQGQNANAINGQATMAGAFGDAQYGNEQALNNFYAGQNLNNLESTGMNNAYSSALGAFQNQQQAQLGAASQLGNLGSNIASTGLNAASQLGNVGQGLASNNLNAASALGNVGQGLASNNMNAASGLSSLGQAQQATGIAGSNAMFNAGTQQQQLSQAQLTEAYTNFMNQVNWPYQQLNTQIASTANSPYQVPTANLAPTSATAANVNSFAAMAGGLGSLLGGSGGNSSAASALAGFSDRRLKKNIKKIGKLLNGLNWYSFKYLWSEKTMEGVMSDEVRRIIPAAVGRHSSGFDVVDYRMVLNG